MNRPSPDDMKAIYAMEYVDSIEKENNKLKKKIKTLKLIQETNEKQIQNDIKEREELKKENKKLKEELQRYKNTKAIQKGNDVSKWKPWCMSYVDRELNYF